MGYVAGMEFELFCRILRALADTGVDYVLVGGVAVNLHGVVRATEDIDLFVRLDDGNIERLKSALRSVWDDPELATFSAKDFDEGYPTLRYAPPGTALVVDIITRIGTKIAFTDLEYQTIDVGGATARVATIPTLIRMKEGTLRPIDQADAAALSAHLRQRADRGLDETR